MDYSVHGLWIQFFVGQTKGRLASLILNAQVIDITHAITPEKFVQGSMLSWRPRSVPSPVSPILVGHDGRSGSGDRFKRFFWQFVHKYPRERVERSRENDASLRLRSDSVDGRVGRKSAGIAVDRLEIGIVDGNEKERFKNERPTVHVRLTTTASDIDTILQ